MNVEAAPHRGDDGEIPGPQYHQRVTPATNTRATTRANATRRQIILDTATTVFAEKGIVAIRVRDISERYGIHSGGLYHHFKSKEEMVAEILVPIVTSQVEAFDRITAKTSDPVEILTQGIEAAVAQTAANPDVARILQNNAHQISDYPGLDEVVRQRRAMRQRIENVIDDGIGNVRVPGRRRSAGRLADVLRRRPRRPPPPQTRRRLQR